MNRPQVDFAAASDEHRLIEVELEWSRLQSNGSVELRKKLALYFSCYGGQFSAFGKSLGRLLTMPYGPPTDTLNLRLLHHSPKSRALEVARNGLCLLCLQLQFNDSTTDEMIFPSPSEKRYWRKEAIQLTY